MSKFEKSIYGYRRKAGKCKDCGFGQVWEYEESGMIPKIKKCEVCGNSQEDYE